MKAKFQFAGILALAMLAGALAEPATAQNRRAQRQQKRRAAEAAKTTPQPAAQTTPPQTPPTDKQQGAGEASAPGKTFVPGAGPRAGMGPGVPPQFMERLRQMTPQDQERFLNNHQRFRNMPPERQEQIRQNLRRWNGMTPEQRRRILDIENRLQQLTPEERHHFRQDLMPQLQQLPPVRRQAIARRLNALRGMTDEEREARLKDEAFFQGMSPEDRDLLREFARLRIAPGAPQEPLQDNPPME